LTKYHAVLEYDLEGNLARVANYELHGFDFTLLWNGRYLSAGIPSDVCLYMGAGDLPDYVSNPLSWPICSDRLANILCNSARDDIQLLECQIFRQQSMEEVLGYKIVNPLRRFSALDLTRSRISRDKWGRIIAVLKIAILDDKIDSKVHIFRLVEWPYMVIVTDGLAREFIGRDFVGLAFERL
jgi:hypothetical protein